MNDPNDNTKGYSEDILRTALSKLRLEGYDDTDNALETLAKKYYEKFTEAEKKLPYWINVVEAMNEGYRSSGKNENGHTRFLHNLLRYTSNNTLPILNSFMNRFTDRKDIKYQPDQDKIIVNHTFNKEGQWRHPDIYINRIGTGNDSETISVIFENKIDYANDREEQVEDYIRGMYRDRHNNCENEGLDNNCYAFYLIADKLSKRSDDDNHDMFGRQKVSSDVLSRLISDDHYILLSYKDDILPWLKNDILPYLRIVDKYLILNIKLYLQYLENKFNLQEDINEIKLKTLKDINGMEKLAFKEICALKAGIERYLKGNIINRFKTVCEKAGFEEDLDPKREGFDKGYKYKLINNFSIWCEINLNERDKIDKIFTIGLAVDDPELDSDLNKKLKEYENEKKYSIDKEKEWERELEKKDCPDGYCCAWTIEELDWSEFSDFIDDENKLYKTLTEFIKEYKLD